MKKYDRKLILNYIIGNDIEGYDVDILEEDINFMMQVIEFSKDKNIYNLCSDKIKNNPEFIKFMIDIFSNIDFNFTLKVVEDYLKYMNYKYNNDDVFEILIIMKNKIKNCKCHDNNNFELELLIASLVNLNYEALTRKAQSAIISNQHNEKYDSNYIGKGFLYLEHNFSDRKIIKDFFAEKMSLEIFNEIEDLEKYMHKENNNKKIGLNSNAYIINYLFSIDQSLSKYIACNPNLVSRIKRKIDMIIQNWDIYNYNEMIYIIEYISNSYYNYFSPNILEQQVFKYLADVLDKKELYDTYLNYIYDINLEDDILYKKLYREEVIDKSKLDFETVRWLNKLEREVKNMLLEGYHDSYINNTFNNNDGILVDFNKNKKM